MSVLQRILVRRLILDEDSMCTQIKMNFWKVKKRTAMLWTGYSIYQRNDTYFQRMDVVSARIDGHIQVVECRDALFFRYRRTSSSYLKPMSFEGDHIFGWKLDGNKCPLF